MCTPVPTHVVNDASRYLNGLLSKLTILSVIYPLELIEHSLCKQSPDGTRICLNSWTFTPQSVVFAVIPAAYVYKILYLLISPFLPPFGGFRVIVDFSERLKQAEIAQVFWVIYQNLLAISEDRQTNPPAGTDQVSPAPFTPSRSPVLVTALLHLSLFLSLSVSALAIQAKMWCFSFMWDRSGRMYEQGRRRQERWNGILRWKVEYVTGFLPMVMSFAFCKYARKRSEPTSC